MGKRSVTSWVVLVASLGSWAGGTHAVAAPPPPPMVVLPPRDENAELNALLAQLGEIGARMAQANSSAQLAAYNLQQADLLAQVAGRYQGEEKIPWLRRMADALNAAALDSAAGDQTAVKKLQQLEECVGRWMPGSAIAAYVTYREMQAGYAKKLATSGDKIREVQLEWRNRLAQFVQTYPQADDTARALMELGQVCEFLDQKDEAHRCYQQLTQRYAGQPVAGRAEGALRRLDLHGKVLQLALPLLDSPYEKQDVPFDLDDLRGKVVVVYFWATVEGDCTGEFAVLRQLLGRYQDRGLDLLCVNLDRTPEEAKAYLNGARAPGTHVFQRGGLDGVVAARYGVMVLPSLILVDRDGTVLTQTTDLTALERELRTRFATADDK